MALKSIAGGQLQIRYFVYNTKDRYFDQEWLQDPLFQNDLMIDLGFYKVPKPGKCYIPLMNRV
jgi:hypothetical protein